jgi:hypothetical protein
VVTVPKSQQSVLTILLLLASLSTSIYTLCISVYVFAIGGSSNIRQLAGASGYQLWEMWKDTWPTFLLLNPLSILLALIAIYLPPSSMQNRDWMWLRFFVLLGAAISVCLTVGKPPDA